MSHGETNFKLFKQVCFVGMLSRLVQGSLHKANWSLNAIRMSASPLMNSVCFFSKTYDPNAVKDAPRPKPEEFKFSEPYRYNISEEMLNDYPDAFKRVFGLDTASQSDINKLKKQEIIHKFQRRAYDTGSSEVQIALLTERIRRLTEHLWYHHQVFFVVVSHVQDYSAKRRMYILVGKRKKLMKYLRENNFERYVYTLRELKMNDIGPHLPIPSYRQTQSASELKLRFRNDNRYPPNPFYQDGNPE